MLTGPGCFYGIERQKIRFQMKNCVVKIGSRIAHTFVIMSAAEKKHLPKTAIPHWKCKECGLIKKSM